MRVSAFAESWEAPPEKGTPPTHSWHVPGPVPLCVSVLKHLWAIESSFSGTFDSLFCLQVYFVFKFLHKLYCFSKDLPLLHTSGCHLCTTPQCGKLFVAAGGRLASHNFIPQQHSCAGPSMEPITVWEYLLHQQPVPSASVQKGIFVTISSDFLVLPIMRLLPSDCS